MNEDKQQNKKSHPDVLKWAILGLLVIAVIVLIFGIGILVGEKKARFSYLWAEQYHRNFAGPQGGFFDDWRSFPRGDFIESHGTFGEIIELQVNGFVIKGEGDVEKIIVITDQTIIQKGREVIKRENLEVGNWVVIIGSPNEEGQIEAKLIRIFNGELEGSPMPFRPARFPFFL
jgi:hypothetical protein